MLATDAKFPAPEDDVAFAEGVITLWGNMLAMIGAQLCANGVAREDVINMMTALHRTNEATIKSPRARESAARHLASVCRALRKA